MSHSQSVSATREHAPTSNLNTCIHSSPDPSVGSDAQTRPKLLWMPCHTHVILTHPVVPGVPGSPLALEHLGHP
jgi:hypothetical protein